MTDAPANDNGEGKGYEELFEAAARQTNELQREVTELRRVGRLLAESLGARSVDAHERCAERGALAECSNCAPMVAALAAARKQRLLE